MLLCSRGAFAVKSASSSQKTQEGTAGLSDCWNERRDELIIGERLTGRRRKLKRRCGIRGFFFCLKDVSVKQLCGPDSFKHILMSFKHMIVG